MMNQKEIDAAIKRFDDPNFDFESEMYRILGKLKKSEDDLFTITNRIGKAITRYIDKEWGNEPIEQIDLAELIVYQTEGDEEYKKIKAVLTDEENFYLQTVMFGAILNKMK